MCLISLLKPEIYYGPFFYEFYLTLRYPRRRMVRTFYEVLPLQSPALDYARLLLAYVGSDTKIAVLHMRDTYDTVKNDWCNDFIDGLYRNTLNRQRVVKVLSANKLGRGHLFNILNQFRGTNRVVVVCGYMNTFVKWFRRTVSYFEGIMNAINFIYIDYEFRHSLKDKANFFPEKYEQMGPEYVHSSTQVFQLRALYDCSKDVAEIPFISVCQRLVTIAEKMAETKHKEHETLQTARYRLILLAERSFLLRKAISLFPRTEPGLSATYLEKAFDQIIENVTHEITSEDALFANVYNIFTPDGEGPLRKKFYCHVSFRSGANCSIQEVPSINDTVFFLPKVESKRWVVKMGIIMLVLLTIALIFQYSRRRRFRQSTSPDAMQQRCAGTFLKVYKPSNFILMEDFVRSVSRIVKRNAVIWSDYPEGATKLRRQLLVQCFFHNPALLPCYLHGSPVGLRAFKMQDGTSRRELLERMEAIRAGLDHPNVQKLIGSMLDRRLYVAVFEGAGRACLREFLDVINVRWDWPFKLVVLHDLAHGMEFIHMKGIGYHGSLSTSSCYFDLHMRVKISLTDFQCLAQFCDLPTMVDESDAIAQLWIAPEILRCGSENQAMDKADVYSFSIIMQEIFYQHGPFYVQPDQLPEQRLGHRSRERARAIVNLVKQRRRPAPFRPYADKLEAKHRTLVELMIRCWLEIPSERPTFQRIAEAFAAEVGGCNLRWNIGNIYHRLLLLTRHLHRTVQKRHSALFNEMVETQGFLYHLFPPDLATRLITSVSVPPKVYNSTTIYFSDIVGFTDVSSVNEPEDICKMLDILFTGYDSILSYYQVYPVTRIGDAYVFPYRLFQLASGLGGSLHPSVYAREMAMVALQVVHMVRCLRFSFLKGHVKKLRIRTGIASGTCMGGLIGQLDKTPQFMLVGHLVEVAQSMEGKGRPMRIHIEQSTYDLIKTHTDLFRFSYHTHYVTEDNKILRAYWLDSVKWPISLQGRIDEKRLVDVFPEEEIENQIGDLR
ncbi:Pkinase Tyr and Guanylate cyc domain containing p rotein [Trichuris trichiura]|uniref:guanylate cyclase n=1 Tax=Trichuris trichiura TaxID=36087 RepID=A0A077ZGK0_TRITR|nr:Pkinase Tyr and Guanylate cyc domain containing p rotein [Trichuris trichiura]